MLYQKLAESTNNQVMVEVDSEGNVTATGYLMHASSNLQLSVQLPLDASHFNGVSKSFVVNAKELVKVLPKATQLHYSHDTIQLDGFSLEVSRYSDNFDRKQMTPQSRQITFPFEQLAFLRTASASNNFGYYLDGICVLKDTVCATNRYRLHLVPFETGVDRELMIPNALFELIPSDTSNLNISVTDDDIALSGPGFEIWCESVDNGFPPVEELINNVSDQFRGQYRTGDASPHLENALCLFEHDCHDGVVTLNSEGLAIQAENREGTTYAGNVQSIDMTPHTKDDVELVINLDYLSDALEQLDTPHLYANDPYSPILLKSGERKVIIVPEQM